MKNINIISACGIAKVLNDNKHISMYRMDNIKLASHEISTLLDLIEKIRSISDNYECFEGYYLGYSIPQISKEFDVLRFSTNSVLNIELKSSKFSDLPIEVKIEEMQQQMRRNHYYLEFLNIDISIYTYIENEGLYRYNGEESSPELVSVEELVAFLDKNSVNNEIDPNNLFVPSNYFVSPFNNTNEFLSGSYFLTSHQEQIKNEIIEKFKADNFIHCISANAGTGKTLLLYDIAKELMEEEFDVKIIHCGKLNNGHDSLNKVGWKIYAPYSCTNERIDNMIMKGTDIILIDEAQRFHNKQLNLLISKAIDEEIPMIFSYDPKQFLSKNEKKDIYNHILKKNIDVMLTKSSLTNKIRSNKELASFIKNLFNVGSSKDHLDYSNISLDYLDNLIGVKTYLDYLRENGWKFITFTSSMYNIKELGSLSDISGTNAHDIIGQEFQKVVFVMDENFQYDGNGLRVKKTYYSLEGMLYQIVTRSIGEIKIVVFRNPDLLCKLMEIKNLEKITNDD